MRVVDASVDLGYFYPVLILLVLLGTTNGVNLTDGLDGLAAGCCAIVLFAFTAMTFITAGAGPAGPRAAVRLPGRGLRRLPVVQLVPGRDLHGRHRVARAWAARSPALAVMTKTEVLLLIIGGIFVIEALSVLIQVFAFQRFRRRVFLMAPIHHHFEMLAWSETKIILRFWIVAAICSAIGFTLYQQSIT